MDIKAVARGCLNYIQHKDEGTELSATPLEPARSSEGNDGNHAAWMLHEIIDGNVEGEKAHRWLGYAQALLVVADELSLEECKMLNKNDGVFDGT